MSIKCALLAAGELSREAAMRLGWATRRCLVVAGYSTALGLGISQLHAQVGTSVKATSGGVAIHGNYNTVVIGLTEPQVRRMVASLMRPLSQQTQQDRADIARLKKAIGATETQLDKMLMLAGRVDVPGDRRWLAMAEIMADYKTLKQQVAALPASELKPLAEAAVADVNLSGAKSILAASVFARSLRDQVTFKRQPHGVIEITNGWDARNLSGVQIPQLVGMRTPSGQTINGTVQFYRPAQPFLRAAFAELQSKGLLSHVHAWCGSFVPRAIAPGQPRLSSHALGISFDLNCDELRLRSAPPPEFIEVANVFQRHRFVWGGLYPSYKDLAHFQFIGVPSSQDADRAKDQ